MQSGIGTFIKKSANKIEIWLQLQTKISEPLHEDVCVFHYC